MKKDLAIQVESLSKVYRLGVEDESRDNLATAMASFFRNPISNYRRYRSLYDFRDIDTAGSGPGSAADLSLIHS